MSLQVLQATSVLAQSCRSLGVLRLPSLSIESEEMYKEFGARNVARLVELKVEKCSQKSVRKEMWH